MPRKNARTASPVSRNTFRIVAGEWRGRRLKFHSGPGVRPTPDRVRETLFNWLQPVIRGAHCLDLFAGSGALGLEALSRGAGKVVFVERSAAVAQGISEQLAALGAAAPVRCIDAFAFLAGNTDTFDVAFLDPPFGDSLMRRAFAALLASGALNPGARVYMEAAAGDLEAALPEGWQLLRQGRAGQVAYGLAVQEQSAESGAG